MTMLLYDADCGFCTRAAGLAPRLHLNAEIGTIQGSDLAALGIDPSRAEREIPAIADGTVLWGHRAIAAAMRTGPLPVRVLGRIGDLRILDPLLSRLYTWVADHRHDLPGGTATCRQAIRPDPGLHARDACID